MMFTVTETEKMNTHDGFLVILA